MAVDWLKIRNDYINGGVSYKELSEKYAVSFSAIEKKSRAEGWRGQRDKQRERVAKKLREKTENALVQKEINRVERLLSVSDELVSKIERAVAELSLAQVTNKTKTKVIEYKNKDRADKPTKETETGSAAPNSRRCRALWRPWYAVGRGGAPAAL